MSRDLTSGMVSVTTADVVRPAYFVRMQFDSNDSPSYLNVWSGVGDLAYGGNTYTGVAIFCQLVRLRKVQTFLRLALAFQ